MGFLLHPLFFLMTLFIAIILCLCFVFCEYWQDRIIARLQQPYSLDCIPVEAEYQVGYPMTVCFCDTVDHKLFFFFFPETSCSLCVNGHFHQVL